MWPFFSFSLKGYIYIYIAIHRQIFSLYHNTPVGQYTRDSRSWDENPIYLGCLSIQENHVTDNYSTNNNVVFFFCFRFEKSIREQLLTPDHNTLD